MKHTLTIDLFDTDTSTCVRFLDRDVEVRRVGCRGSLARARALVEEHDGQVDAIALDGLPITLQLGAARTCHPAGDALRRAAHESPVVDGSGVRSALERWAIDLAERAQPGLLAGKRTLLVPGLNHAGLAHALSQHTQKLRYADPAIFFGLPVLAGVGSASSLPRVAAATLRALRRTPPERLSQPPTERRARLAAPFRWAEVLAGDVRMLRALGPASLHGKTVVVEALDEDDLADLRRRGVTRVVTLMPEVGPVGGLARHAAPVLEALLAALRPGPLPPDEDTYLDLLSELEWRPAVRFLQPEGDAVHRFAFVIHPLDLSFIHADPRFRWTRRLPDALVERLAARMPPLRVARVTGVRSELTGQRVEGELYALGATPREMVRRDPRFTYRKLGRAARMAAGGGARILGLGAFTSVIGDAGVTVARDSPIAVTSGNSLTVAATLEAAKQAARSMGLPDLEHGRAMVIGATGSIGSVCARMLALAIRDVVLVSIEPERLIELKRRIRAETPGAAVAVATRADGLIGDCDLIVTATSAFGQRILDISQCKPGAILCDVARPPDVNAAEAALRPDVLVIESGEVRLPGEVDLGYDIGLPPGVAYACLAETALLAMDGRYECFTLGRELSVERVKEIYGLSRRHGLRLAGLRSLGRWVGEEEILAKRELAERLRADPELFERTRREAARRLAQIPVRSKGVAQERRRPAPLERSRIGGRMVDLVFRVAGRPPSARRS